MFFPFFHKPFRFKRFCVAADDSVLTDNGKIDVLKTGMILYDPFGTNYVSLGQIVGKPWREGRKFM